MTPIVAPLKMVRPRKRPYKRRKIIDSPLKQMWVKVVVKSCADGSMKVEPEWIGPEYDPEEGGGPGVMERMSAAKWLEVVINEYLNKP